MIKRIKQYFQTNLGGSSNISVQGMVVAQAAVEGVQEISLDERRLRALIDSSSDVFVIFSKSFGTTYISSSIRNVLGYQSSDLNTGDFTMWDIVHSDDLGNLQEKMYEVFQMPGVYVAIDVRLKHYNGEWCHCSISFRQYKDEPDSVIATLRDVTDIKRTQELMVHQSYYDYVTGLPNRKKFEEELQLMLHRVKATNVNMAVMRFDLDHLKDINDTLGHGIGDKLLKAVSLQLRETVSKDAYLYRLSGNEFAFVLLDYTHANYVLETADKILELFQTSFQIEEYDLFETASIGISLYPDDGLDSESLFKNAGLALYRAKQNGKNTYSFYTATLNAQAFKRFSLSNDFRSAMQKQQFVLYYQPRVDGRTGRIVGAEALIRWEHEEWGLISPQDFIPIAEENGLITPLGEWVLRNACSKLKEWVDRGLLLKLSVNFSIYQFLNSDVVETVKRIVHETQVDISFLEIEITETSLLPNGLVVYNAVRDLRAMGVQVLFDDFGTGYSSLSWLHQLELDGLKIDRSFIQKISENSTTLEIVRSIIKLAHDLDLSVIAEGVESPREWELLREEQCDEIQGYLFSRPLPAVQFDQLLFNERVSIQEDSSDKNFDIVNRRQYFRVVPPHPIVGTMTVASIRGRLLHIGYSEVLIHDIGPGGLRFLSNLRFASVSEVVLRFKVCLLNGYFECDGTIVWSDEMAGGVFQYGIQFVITEANRERLIQDLNELALRLKMNRAELGDMKFFTQSVNLFFIA